MENEHECPYMKRYQVIHLLLLLLCYVHRIHGTLKKHLKNRHVVVCCSVGLKEALTKQVK